MQKKGITPLLATVLIVGIIVAVAAVVFFWGKQLTEGIQEKEGEISQLELSCTNVHIDVTQTTAGSVTVENKGALVEGVILVVRGNGDTGNTLFDDPIEQGSSRSYPYEGIPNVPNVERITVVPALGKGIYRPCSEQRVDITV